MQAYSQLERLRAMYYILVLMDQSDWHSKCFYRVSLKAVILDERGYVLMVREKNNPNWNLPGGGMDYGEDDKTALKRELLEEVGLDGDFEAVPLGIRPGYIKDKQAWQMWVVYKVAPSHFDFKVGIESDEIAFLDPEMFRAEKPHITAYCEQAKIL